MPTETVREQQDLLPESVKRPAAVLAVVCGVVFVVLAVMYSHHDEYGAFDRSVYDSLSGRGVPYRFLVHLADLVPPTFTLAVVVLAATTAALRKWRYTALVVLGPGLTMLVAETGKLVIGRTLEGQLAMPSGHTAGVTTVSLVVAVLLVDLARRHAALTAGLTLAAVTAMAVLIAAVMITLDFHYATDTIAGYCEAVAVTLGTAFAVDGGFRRWGRPARTEPSEAGATLGRPSEGRAA